MWEFTFYNEQTKEEKIAFGYNEDDARRRWDIGEEWELLNYYYID